VNTEDIRRLPYLLPWGRVLFLIRSITSSGTTWPGDSCSPSSAGRWRCAGRVRGMDGGTRRPRARLAPRRERV